MSREIEISTDLVNPNRVSSSPALPERLIHLINQVAPSNPAALDKIFSADISTKDLLIYQVQASNYHLRIEMIAKTADSVLHTIRRAESGQ